MLEATHNVNESDCVVGCVQYSGSGAGFDFPCPAVLCFSWQALIVEEGHAGVDVGEFRACSTVAG